MRGWKEGVRGWKEEVRGWKEEGERLERRVEGGWKKR